MPIEKERKERQVHWEQLCISFLNLLWKTITKPQSVDISFRNLSYEFSSTAAIQSTLHVFSPHSFQIIFISILCVYL